MSKALKDHVCEEALFAKLYRQHAKNLHDFLYFKFGAALNPDDQVQEAFLKLWENCKKVAPHKAKSFLFTVASNTSLNKLKHEKVVLKYEQQQKDNRDEQDPQFLLEEKQYLQKYQKALARLSDAQRTAFLLNKAEGKKHHEIAEMLNISQKAVEKRIYAALKTLREDLKEL